MTTNPPEYMRLYMRLWRNKYIESVQAYDRKRDNTPKRKEYIAENLKNWRAHNKEHIRQYDRQRYIKRLLRPEDR